ncbi:MAG: DUF3489 domain-containing protein [Rhodospirillales bacterium]|nr:DUF3489 domain-containing protein [Rhodospirillales bacterium]
MLTMSAVNLSADIVEMLLARGFAEMPSKNKQWRIFFQPPDRDTRWFIHTGGKVRRGKSVHNSTAVTPEVRHMLGRYWLEKRGGKLPVKRRIAKDKILTLLKNGATTADIVNATGWKPHSVRAYLSRLRNGGHIVSHSISTK